SPTDNPYGLTVPQEAGSARLLWEERHALDAETVSRGATSEGQTLTAYSGHGGNASGPGWTWRCCPEGTPAGFAVTEPQRFRHRSVRVTEAREDLHAGLPCRGLCHRHRALRLGGGVVRTASRVPP